MDIMGSFSPPLPPPPPPPTPPLSPNGPIELYGTYTRGKKRINHNGPVMYEGSDCVSSEFTPFLLPPSLHSSLASIVSRIECQGFRPLTSVGSPPSSVSVTLPRVMSRRVPSHCTNLLYLIGNGLVTLISFFFVYHPPSSSLTRHVFNASRRSLIPTWYGRC